MSGFEGVGNLRGDGEGVVERDGAVLDTIRQRRPFNEFEDQQTEITITFDDALRMPCRYNQLILSQLVPPGGSLRSNRSQASEGRSQK